MGVEKPAATIIDPSAFSNPEPRRRQEPHPSSLVLHTPPFRPQRLTLLVSRSLRQSSEPFHYVKQNYSAIGRPLKAVKENDTQLEFTTGSRIVSPPVRRWHSFQGVHLLALGGGARIAADLCWRGSS